MIEQLSILENIDSAEPILQWMGGKKRLFNEIYKRFPKEFNRYYEPFIGGGFIAFKLGLENTVINDLNKELFNLYSEIKDNPYSISNKLNEIVINMPDNLKSKKEYYKHIIHKRNRFWNKENWEQHTQWLAAATIFLNAMSFNALYRVNSKNEYNSPFGKNRTKSSLNFDKKIMDLHKLMNQKNFQIFNLDYSDVLKMVEKNDFVYLDPPYDEADNMYLNSWKFKEQVRLKTVLDELTLRGVKWMVSNSDTANIRTLYSSYKIEGLKIKSNIASNLEHRTTINELIIRNYE